MKEYIADFLIYTAGLLWGLELIPQVLKTLKTKKVKDLSLGFFLMCFLAYVLYCFGNAILSNYNIIIAHIPSFISNLTMIVLIIKFKSN